MGENRGGHFVFPPERNLDRATQARRGELKPTRTQEEGPLGTRSRIGLRVLGVDPASAGPTGYAVVELDGPTCRVLHYGAYKVPPKRQKSSPGAALQDVHALLGRLISEYQPDVVAVESVFAALNLRTALRLAEVRGVILLAAEQFGLEVRSYSPREVKASVTGYGQASKQQMQVMVRALLGMKEAPEPLDAADALAVALCHIGTAQRERRWGLEKKEITRPGKGPAARLRKPSPRAAEPPSARHVPDR